MSEKGSKRVENPNAALNLFHARRDQQVRCGRRHFGRTTKRLGKMNRKTTTLLGSVLVATVIAVASAAVSATLCGDHLERFQHNKAGMVR